MDGDKSQSTLRVVPYNELYDGWSKGGIRSGFMASAINSYEYAYKFWDVWTSDYYPDLLDSGTFAVWQELLPQPCSVSLTNFGAQISWNHRESRVRNSNMMGRYSLNQHDSSVEVVAEDWRQARAEAYVMAWEKMAANEPADRYKSIIIANQKR